MRRRMLAPLLPLLATLAVGCSDPGRPAALTAVPAPRDASAGGPAGLGIFHRYVAIGTSISMGWRSDGVIAASQDSSWPAQLTRLEGRELSQPYIAGTGCRSPLRAPLALGVRLSGEGAGADPATLSCSGLMDGITVPTANVAINAATTHDALFTTPENVADPANARLYPLVLGAGQTQVTAMLAQNPKLVSVELGGNDVLNARSGIAIEGVTMTPYAAWARDYDAILEQVAGTAQRALLVGLTHDVGAFPAFRRGDELWADRMEFLGFNVVVSPDCAGSANLLFVPVRVPTAVATGVGRAHAGLGPYTLSCAAAGPTTMDFVLDPGEAAHVNSLLDQMNAHIAAEAARRGWAYFELDALYGRPGLKGPFSVGQLMLTAAPYGPFLSLDGVHPSGAGSAVLADAAAQALDDAYRIRTVAAGER